MKEKVTVNKEQRLYVIASGKGYSTLGFDYVKEQCNKLVDELGFVRGLCAGKAGTLKAYRSYQKVIELSRLRFEKHGIRSKVCLTKQLEGLEGKRVEVVDCCGEKRRFYVGKSTGWIPCHLEIARRDSKGGMAVTGAPFGSVKVVEGMKRY